MKKFSELVGPDATQAANDDRKLRRIIASIMPPDSLDHVQFCRIENRILKVTLDNASWLARLRFSSRQIIDELNRQGITVSDTTWHVAPEKAKIEVKTPNLRTRERSTKSASIVQSTAETMEDDELKQALLKVAEQLKKND